MSNPEELIMQLLRAAHIKFIKEYRLSDFRNGLQRFDFYLPEKNIAIEYNGQQHYYRIAKFQRTEAEFKKQCEQDRRKISYCLANHITLYCIPYWDLSKLQTAADLFKPEYIAKSKFHNDEAYKKFDKAN